MGDDANLYWPELSDPDADIDSDALPTFHSFRHTFAAAWIANGGDLVELSRHLGHSNPAITASVYAGEFEAAARAEERRNLIGSMFGDRETTPEGSPVDRSWYRCPRRASVND
ncbi:MAG TPA: tyrosine-type recombinase/integrase [Solirubrobacterales bacterium]|nr:tyrosine-type recombinase/integrase [Solirubrobacterales bacterium]